MESNLANCAGRYPNRKATLCNLDTTISFLQEHNGTRQGCAPLEVDHRVMHSIKRIYYSNAA